MALFDTLITDIASRFGLGANAGSFVRAILNLVTSSPGGVGGFLDRLKSAGLGSEVSSWLGHTNAAPLAESQLDRAVGPTALGNIASQFGLGKSAASAAVGYTLPKLIGTLTPGGAIPTTLSSEIMNFLSPSAPPVAPREPVYQRAAPPNMRPVEQVAPRSMAVLHDQPQMARWLWPLLGALAVLGLGSYLFSARPPAPTTPAVVQAPAPTPPPTPTQAPRLTLSNDNGVIHYSGSVHDEETRTSIVNSLKAVFGADRIQGDIGIDLNRGATPWLVNFRPALENFKVPGVQAVFDGNSVKLGGVISDADRDRISNALKGELSPNLAVGRLSDNVNEMITVANTKVAADLSSLKTGFGPNDLIGVLNQSIVNFPAGSSEVPAATVALLQKAATQMKQLPPGTKLEIAGYTDNNGDAAANVSLSQQRAEAVRNVLVSAGVDPSMLIAKGYGGANPVASNDLLEGRLRNRRIEYRLAQL
jgi:outer membrane protein OmpA-like peptidoglycan-associated protein/uncharacterized protein YidB (DUF937 family)